MTCILWSLYTVYYILEIKIGILPEIVCTDHHWLPLVESGLNTCCEQVSLMRHICIENCILVLISVVLIARVVLFRVVFIAELYCT